MATAAAPTGADKARELTEEQNRIIEFRTLLEDAKTALKSGDDGALTYNPVEVAAAEARFQKMLSGYPDILDKIKDRARVSSTRRDMKALLVGLRQIGEDRKSQSRGEELADIFKELDAYVDEALIDVTAERVSENPNVRKRIQLALVPEPTKAPSEPEVGVSIVTGETTPTVDMPTPTADDTVGGLNSMATIVGQPTNTAAPTAPEATITDAGASESINPEMKRTGPVEGVSILTPAPTPAPAPPQPRPSGGTVGAPTSMDVAQTPLEPAAAPAAPGTIVSGLGEADINAGPNLAPARPQARLNPNYGAYQFLIEELRIDTETKDPIAFAIIELLKDQEELGTVDYRALKAYLQNPKGLTAEELKQYNDQRQLVEQGLNQIDDEIEIAIEEDRRLMQNPNRTIQEIHESSDRIDELRNKREEWVGRSNLLDSEISQKGRRLAPVRSPREALALISYYFESISAVNDSEEPSHERAKEVARTYEREAREANRARIGFLERVSGWFKPDLASTLEEIALKDDKLGRIGVEHLKKLEDVADEKMSYEKWVSEIKKFSPEHVNKVYAPLIVGYLKATVYSANAAKVDADSAIKADKLLNIIEDNVVEQADKNAKGKGIDHMLSFGHNWEKSNTQGDSAKIDVLAKFFRDRETIEWAKGLTKTAAGIALYALSPAALLTGAAIYGAGKLKNASIEAETAEEQERLDTFHKTLLISGAVGGGAMLLLGAGALPALAAAGVAGVLPAFVKRARDIGRGAAKLAVVGTGGLAGYIPFVKKAAAKKKEKKKDKK